MTYLLFRYLHFFAIIALAGTIIIENMAIKPVINGEDARNLARVDAVYGAAATLVALFGIILWFGVGKPSEFYTQNPIFLTKVCLFVLVGIISLHPTIFFIRHRKSQAESIAVPASLRITLRLELILLLIIPALAFLMARGIGLPA